MITVHCYKETPFFRFRKEGEVGYTFTTDSRQMAEKYAGSDAKWVDEEAEPKRQSFVSYYAVVMVQPGVHGTDPTKGETLFTKRTHLEAMTLKEGVLKGLTLVGWTEEDGWQAYPPRWYPMAAVGILVCPMDHAPKMEETA